MPKRTTNTTKRPTTPRQKRPKEPPPPMPQRIRDMLDLSRHVDHDTPDDDLPPPPPRALPQGAWRDPERRGELDRALATIRRISNCYWRKLLAVKAERESLEPSEIRRAVILLSNPRVDPRTLHDCLAPGTDVPDIFYDLAGGRSPMPIEADQATERLAS